jgi:hypothetical protein
MAKIVETVIIKNKIKNDCSTSPPEMLPETVRDIKFLTLQVNQLAKILPNTTNFFLPASAKSKKADFMQNSN